MKKLVLIISFCVLFISGASLADTFGTGANQFTIDFVDITGDASSANGTNITHYSPGEYAYRAFYEPGHDFRIAKFELTNDQWSKFLNSYGTLLGFPRHAYDEDTFYTGANIPVNEVSWLEAAQFINYLNTSTGNQAAYKFTGTKGTDNYTYTLWQPADDGYNPDNPFRNSNAKYFLPTESEWVKAAHFNGTYLQTYATINDGIIAQGDGVSGVGWNYVINFNEYATDPKGPWDVGSGSEELNGTFDITGNVSEWVENPWDPTVISPDGYRGMRGGSYNSREYYCVLNYRSHVSDQKTEYIDVGIRVASILETCDFVLAGDLDDNCKVNLADFALMATNWLIDCTTNPSETACNPK